MSVMHVRRRRRTAMLPRTPDTDHARSLPVPPAPNRGSSPRGRLLQDRACHRQPAIAADTGQRHRWHSELLRQQLSRSCRRSALGQGSTGRARSMGLRHGLGAIHLRDASRAQIARRRAEQISSHRRQHPLFQLLRREWRSFRDAARRGRRCHQRRAEPREHRRRHPPLQGEALSLPQQRHARPRSEAGGGEFGGRPLQVDRHRRRLFDGRHHRRPAFHLLARGPAWRDSDGRRFACGRIRRRRRPRNARILRRRSQSGHHHRNARQGARRRGRGLYFRAQGNRGVASPALASLSVFQYGRRLASPRRRSRCSSSSTARRGAQCASACTRTANVSAKR